jgi:Fe2+ or Zn2+ uptake regulation protein
MGSHDYYGERKWCEHCKDYVRYLMSVDHSYCVQCGNKVRLFSNDDAEKFNETVQRHRWQAS